MVNNVFIFHGTEGYPEENWFPWLKEKLEAELKAKQEQEAKAERERLAAEENARKEAEKLAKAPIKQQLQKWIESFDYERIDLIEKETICNSILLKFQGFKDWAKKK